MSIDKIADSNGVSYSDSNTLGWAWCGQAAISLTGDATAFTTITSNTLDFYPIEEHESITFDLTYTSLLDGQILIYTASVDVDSINCDNQELTKTDWVASSDVIDGVLRVS